MIGWRKNPTLIKEAIVLDIGNKRMGARRRLKDGYFHALCAARIDRLLRSIHKRRGDVVVLNFHRVSPNLNPYWPGLLPSSFESLIGYLVEECEITTFRKLAAGEPAAKLRVVISFDDGFRDFVDYVVPVLDRYSIRANQNIVVQSVESGRPPWIVAVMDALASAGEARVRELTITGFGYRLESDDDEAKIRFGTQLANYLKGMRPEVRVGVSADVQALLDDTPADALSPMMDLGDVRSAMEVHELGCHSYSHESMAQMGDSEFDAELARCGEFFKALGHDMRIFAFPNGSYRQDQVKRLQAMGVEHVLVVDERASSATAGIHPRFTMYGTSEPELRARSAGWRSANPARYLHG